MAGDDTRDGDDGDDGLGDPADLRDGVSDADSLLTLSSHFYRGEIDRITTWRSRLDQTTNWAVVLMAAILTWSFSSRDNPHYVLLVGALTVGAFLFIEAQRFQEYDALRGRVRTLETNLFAEGYGGGGPDDEDWRERLAAELRDPSIPLSLLDALGHRLLHVYFLLLSILLAAWWLRISVFATGEPWRQTAAVGDTPGIVVVGVVAATYGAMALLTARSLRQDVRREFAYQSDEQIDEE